MNSKPLIIAHRGFSGIYPENTVLSVSEASNTGADIAEFDVRLTKDKEVVVFHDETVDRILTSETNKRIADFTLKKLKQMDFGSWLDSKYNRCTIATLKELLEFKNNSDQKFDFIIEIKDKNPEELIPKVKDKLLEYNFTFSKGYLSVRDEKAFALAVDNSFSKNKIGLMQKKRFPSEAIELALKLEARYLQLRPKLWTEQDWNKLINSNLLFTIFYGDTVSDFEWMIKKKPYGIFTNFPNRLQKFLFDS